MADKLIFCLAAPSVVWKKTKRKLNSVNLRHLKIRPKPAVVHFQLVYAEVNSSSLSLLCRRAWYPKPPPSFSWESGWRQDPCHCRMSPFLPSCRASCQNSFANLIFCHKFKLGRVWRVLIVTHWVSKGPNYFFFKLICLLIAFCKDAVVTLRQGPCDWAPWFRF